MIEKLLRYLADKDHGLAVEAEDGSIHGIATTRGVVNALAVGSNSDTDAVKSQL